MTKILWFVHDEVNNLGIDVESYVQLLKIRRLSSISLPWSYVLSRWCLPKKIERLCQNPGVFRFQDWKPCSSYFISDWPLSTSDSSPWWYIKHGVGRMCVEGYLSGMKSYMVSFLKGPSPDIITLLFNNQNFEACHKFELDKAQSCTRSKVSDSDKGNKILILNFDLFNTTIQAMRVL